MRLRLKIANDDKECQDCIHFYRHPALGEVCRHRDGRNPNNLEPMNIRIVRSLVGFCTPAGYNWRKSHSTIAGDDTPPPIVA